MLNIIRKIFYRILFIIIISSLTFLIVPSVSAQTCAVVCPADAVCIANPLNACTLEDLAINIANFIFMVATALAPLMLVIAGFYFVTSSGNPQQVETAKKIILYTLIGYGIIFISRGLIFIIRDILGTT